MSPLSLSEPCCVICAEILILLLCGNALIQLVTLVAIVLISIHCLINPSTPENDGVCASGQ